MIWKMKPKKSEVFMTNHAQAFGAASLELEEAQIPFTTKTVNTGTRNRRTGTWLGSVGENTSLEIIYYIYVSVQDEEKAKYVISKCKKIYRK